MESIREDRLGKALTWSLGVHAALALAIVLKSLVWPGDPIVIAPALRVDMVGLPDLLKKDLSQVSKSLPKEELVERLQEAAKDAKKIETIPIEAPPKADDMVLHPKKVEKTAKPTEKEQAAERQKKIESALARIRSLERLKDQSEEKDDAVVIKGNQVSKGTSLSGNAREQANAEYYSLLQATLAETWALPPHLARQNLNAKVVIRIAPSGTVIETTFTQKSGDDQFDAAVLRAIAEAQPLPGPPKEIQDAVSGRGVGVGFPL